MNFERLMQIGMRWPSPADGKAPRQVRLLSNGWHSTEQHRDLHDTTESESGTPRSRISGVLKGAAGTMQQWPRGGGHQQKRRRVAAGRAACSVWVCLGWWVQGPGSRVQGSKGMGNLGQACGTRGHAKSPKLHVQKVQRTSEPNACAADMSQAEVCRTQ